MRKPLQQGDVIINPVEEIPDGAKPVASCARGYILAEGSATGHAHVVKKNAGIEFVENGGKFYLRNARPVTVRHEEHKPVTVPAGTWKIVKVREYDHFSEEARNVAD